MNVRNVLNSPVELTATDNAVIVGAVIAVIVIAVIVIVGDSLRSFVSRILGATPKTDFLCSGLLHIKAQPCLTSKGEAIIFMVERSQIQL